MKTILVSTIEIRGEILRGNRYEKKKKKKTMVAAAIVRRWNVFVAIQFTLSLNSGVTIWGCSVPLDLYAQVELISGQVTINTRIYIFDNSKYMNARLCLLFN